MASHSTCSVACCKLQKVCVPFEQQLAAGVNSQNQTGLLAKMRIVIMMIMHIALMLMATTVTKATVGRQL